MPACHGREDSNGYKEGHDEQRAMAFELLLPEMINRINMIPQSILSPVNILLK
jgi:hypothetical protein